MATKPIEYALSKNPSIVVENGFFPYDKNSPDINSKIEYVRIVIKTYCIVVFLYLSFLYGEVTVNFNISATDAKNKGLTIYV